MMDLQTLHEAVATAAAIRRVRRLQPISGPGELLFPPTYRGDRRGDPPQHIFELRRRNGQEVWCTLLNSVQAEANRHEIALREAADEDDGVPIPYVTVDFTGSDLAPLSRVTSMDAPHRIYDAILRDSSLVDTPFLKSSTGQRIAAATAADATALLEFAPTALIFGSWHSQSGAGQVGAKFARNLVSEIMAIDTPVEVRTNERTGMRTVQSTARRAGVRGDPLGTSRHVPISRGASPADWTFDDETKGEKVRPSNINHGQIPFGVDPLGVTCGYAEQRVTISLAGLRRLRFGARNSAAARTMLAALSLLAVHEQDAHGYALRSRCDLVPDGEAPFELVHMDGAPSPLSLDREQARAVYREAYVKAQEAEFQFESLRLTPQPKLVELVQRSRRIALEGSDDDVPA